MPIDASAGITSSEKNLIIELLKFPAVVVEAGKQLNPSVLVNYTYELVKQFNSFYQTVNILKEPDEQLKNVRLRLSDCTANVIKNGMELLGIQVPNQM